MRGISDQLVAGYWSVPLDNITLPAVPSPQNVTVSLDNVKRDNELRVSFEVFLEWKLPEEFSNKFPRTRRQAASDGSSDAPTGFEVLIANKDNVGTDYATAPTGVGTFRRTLSVRVICCAY